MPTALESLAGGGQRDRARGSVDRPPPGSLGRLHEPPPRNRRSHRRGRPPSRGHGRGRSRQRRRRRSAPATAVRAAIGKSRSTASGASAGDVAARFHVRAMELGVSAAIVAEAAARLAAGDAGAARRGRGRRSPPGAARPRGPGRGLDRGRRGRPEGRFVAVADGRAAGSRRAPAPSVGLVRQLARGRLGGARQSRARTSPSSTRASSSATPARTADDAVRHPSPVPHAASRSRADLALPAGPAVAGGCHSGLARGRSGAMRGPTRRALSPARLPARPGRSMWRPTAGRSTPDAAFCVPPAPIACPLGALTMSKRVELATADRSTLVSAADGSAVGSSARRSTPTG